MGEVFAGFLCGYIVAFAGAPMLAFTLARLRDSSPLIARMLPADAPVVPLIVVLHGALIVVCTLAGLVLGMLLLALKDASGGLGSLNLAFTLLVFGVVLAVAAPIAIVFPAVRTRVLAGGLGALLLFGWLMPYMAQWSKFGSS